jgi:hypothetical protein
VRGRPRLNLLNPRTLYPLNPKETTMQYKTIILELLRERPQMHEQLRKDRNLLPAMELYARELKRSHNGWKDILSQLRPGNDPAQISSEALEIALKEMEDHLPSASEADENEAHSLDEAMVFIRHRTSRG